MSRDPADGVRAERARRLAALPRDADPFDWAYALSQLVDRAETIGQTALGQQLREEIWATGAHAQMPGRRGQAARFDFIPPPLREPAAVARIAALAGETEAPPSFRAHEWDLVWSIESSPRSQPHAALRSAGFYLEYETLVPNTVFGGEEDLSTRFRVLDALGRAAQLARETKNADLAKRTRDRIIARLKQIEANGTFRYMLELGHGLIEVEGIAPGGLQVIDALIEPAMAHFKAGANYHLVRAVLELALETADARKLASTDDIKRRIAESHVEEADHRAAAGAKGMIQAVAIQDAIKAYRGIPGSEDRITELTTRLEGANVATLGELVSISGTVSIPSKKVEALIAEIASRDRDEALLAIGLRFLEDRQQSYERADHLAKQFVLQSLVSMKVLTSYGETIELAPGSPERRDHEAFKNAQMGLGVGNMLLVEVFSRLFRGGMSVDELMAVFEGSPFFPRESIALIRDGTTKWLAGDHVGAVHVLTPQIEAVLRSILRAVGVPVTRVNEGHVQVRLLDQLIRLAAQYGLPDSILFTIEAVLTDRGGNVRNRLAHGWLRIDECTPALTARLVQLLLALATLERTDAKE
jgi:hypothetical protein